MTTVGGPTIDPGRFGRRTRGIALPLAATLVAFVIGGLVVAATGHNPLSAYKAIFDGTGLNWLFPWVSGFERQAAARDLQQTLLVMTPLILTACAVGFSFRAGMFNIGGQGQYWVGLTAALVVGTHLEGTATWLHVTLGMVAAITAGSIWGAIAGVLKATRGAHEVITTIMLNWIAIFVIKWLVELKGPLQGGEPTIPRSDDIADSAHLPTIWGTLQALHAGIFVALAALVVYHLLLNRTTLGFEIRAVGFNPEAARASGISVSRSYILALGISGAFAGLAGSLDLLGWKFHVASNDLDVGTLGFIGIAVALLGRNSAVGILFAALLFACLQTGTAPRNLDPTVFPPELAGNLATIIQALIILFVGAQLLIVYAARSGQRLLPRRGAPADAEPEAGS